MTRVGFLVPTLRVGGAEWATVFVASHLASAGLPVAGFAVTRAEENDDELVASATRLAPLMPQSALFDACDVIVTWGVTDALRDFPGKVVVLVHSNSTPSRRYVLAQATRADAFVAVCRDALHAIPRPLHRCSSVVYNALPAWRTATRSPAAAVAAALGFDERRRVAYAGRVDGVKNLGAICRALREHEQALAGVFFLGGDVEPDVLTMLEEHGRVVRHGSHPYAMSELLSAVDVCVLPSSREGCSLSMLEAMHAERPLVLTDVGVVPELPPSLRDKLTILDPNALDLGSALREARSRRVDYQPELDALFGEQVAAARWATLISELTS